MSSRSSVGDGRCMLDVSDFACPVIQVEHFDIPASIIGQSSSLISTCISRCVWTSVSCRLTVFVQKVSFDKRLPGLAQETVSITGFFVSRPVGHFRAGMQYLIHGCLYMLIDLLVSSPPMELHPYIDQGYPRRVSLSARSAGIPGHCFSISTQKCNIMRKDNYLSLLRLLHDSLSASLAGKCGQATKRDRRTQWGFLQVHPQLQRRIPQWRPHGVRLH